MKVTFDDASLAVMGLTAEEATIDVPDDLGSYSPERRREWVAHEMEQVALELLRDVGAAQGLIPTAAQEAMYRARVRPGIQREVRGRATRD